MAVGARFSRSATIRRSSRRLSRLVRQFSPSCPAAPSASARFRRQIDQALASGTPCIPIYVGLTAEEVAWPGLATRQAITIASADDLPAVQALWRTLASQLPEPVASTEGAARLSTVALPIEWNAKAFSYLLATAMGRQDFSRGEVLVRAFSRHNAVRSTPYDAAATKMDLDALRRKRQFLLIRDYASAVLRLSPDNFRVRRQLGQALIELGELDRGGSRAPPIGPRRAADP